MLEAGNTASGLRLIMRTEINELYRLTADERGQEKTFYSADLAEKKYSFQEKYFIYGYK